MHFYVQYKSTSITWVYKCVCVCVCVFEQALCVFTIVHMLELCSSKNLES